MWTLGRQLSGQKHLLCKHDLNLQPLHHMKKTGVTTHAFNPNTGVEESGQREMNPKRAPWPVSLIKVMSFILNESPCHKKSRQIWRKRPMSLSHAHECIGVQIYTFMCQ